MKYVRERGANTNDFQTAITGKGSPHVPWLLNICYLLLVTAVSPILVYRMVRFGKYRQGWQQKLFGRLPVPSQSGDRVWLHAVSVGEVLQLQSVVDCLRKQHPGNCFVITTTTVTGFDVAKNKFPNDHVCYFPLDFSWAVKRALKQIQPKLVVLVELELWPNFIFEVHKQQIPLTLINGRISENSFRGYYRLRRFISHVLKQFDMLAVQNPTYRDRLLALGAESEKVHVTGSIKFDGVTTDRKNPRTAELRQFFGIKENEAVLIAGSTQPPEEDAAITTWNQLKTEFPNLRLILVPRHKERFEEVAQLVTETWKLPLIRRSQPETSTEPVSGSGPPILLLDTLGEPNACWGLADIAFVGGSLTFKRGGQNMLEPAAYGATVLFGPSTRNFRDVVEMLLEADAARVVADADELTRTVGYFLQNNDEARTMGENAQKLVLSHQGATAATAQLLAPWLSTIPGQESQVESNAA